MNPRKAHPRVCGENQDENILNLTQAGSSPRVRGKRSSARLSRSNSGLIPACAGKTRRIQVRARSNRAHPRVCGENHPYVRPGSEETGSSPRVRGKQAIPGFPGRLRGSSPRVRGKLSARRTRPCTFRLIPACAGKTARSRLSSSSIPAHPRVCGENGYS